MWFAETLPVRLLATEPIQREGWQHSTDTNMPVNASSHGRFRYKAINSAMGMWVVKG